MTLLHPSDRCKNPTQDYDLLGESKWGDKRFERKESGAGFPDRSQCNDCRSMKDLEPTPVPACEPSDRESIEQLSEEEFRRELKLAFDESTRIMNEVHARGELTPRKIAVSLREFRKRHPYRRD